MIPVALAVSLAAVALSLAAPLAWALVFAALLSAFVRLRVPSTLLAFLAWTALLAIALTSWALMVVLLVHGDSTETILRSLGLGLGVVAVLLALGRERDGMVLLSSAGLLALAGLHRRFELRPFVAAAAVAAIAHLAREARPIASVAKRSSLRRPIVAVVVVAIAAAVGLALPPAQRRVEKLAFSMYPPQVPVRSGLSNDDTRLGEVESLATSDRLVLRVWAKRPQKLRARVYLRFDGRIWHVANAKSHEPKPAIDHTPPELARFPGVLRLFPRKNGEDLGRDLLVTRIFPVALDEGLLVAPGDAVAVKTPVDLRVDELSVLLPPPGAWTEPYAVLHRPRVGFGDDGPPDAQSIALPPRIDPRLRDLAATLSKGTNDPREKVRRTVEWVRGAAHYDLNVGAFHSRDPVAEFLFDKKRGYCEYFASAVAVLLRLQGVPSRFVTGFQLDTSNKEGEHFEVRDADAHAWAEAYLPGEGWLEADATPAAEYAALHARKKSALDRLRARLADLWLTLRHGSFGEAIAASKVPIAVVLAAIALFIVGRRLLARRERTDDREEAPRAPLAPGVAAYVARIDRTFDRIGAPRPRTRGLLEHLEAVSERTAESDRRALRDAIDAVHRAAYGGERVSFPELR